MPICYHSLPFNTSLPKEKVTHESSVREVKILLSGINLGDVAEEIENTARIAPLIIIPVAQILASWVCTRDQKPKEGSGGPILQVLRAGRGEGLLPRDKLDEVVVLMQN